MNPGYAAAQLSKAVERFQQNLSAEDRELASSRIRKWTDVLKGFADGMLQIGSRDPVAGTPAWVTLEVAHGGFATGKFMAAGPLTGFEKERLTKLGRDHAPAPRLSLNLSYLNERGIRELVSMLDTGCFRVSIPEHAALLVVTLLAISGKFDEAERIIGEIEPWMDRLRFYPEPADRPVVTTPSVHLETVGEVADRLSRTRQQERIATQNETLNVWVPLHDEFVALVLDSCEAPQAESADALGRPFCECDDRWRARASDLLRRYAELRRIHTLSGKPDRRGEVFCELRRWVRNVLEGPDKEPLSASQEKRVMELLRREFAKRGTMSSVVRCRLRAAQRRDGRLPTHASAAKIAQKRLGEFDRDGGLVDPESVLRPELSEVEKVELFGESSGSIDEHFEFPGSVQRKVRRCMQASVEELIDKGLITSGDVLARLVSQIAGLEMSKQFDDQRVQRIFMQTYQAFRSRRSLLLLHLQKQVRFEELPWVASLLRLSKSSRDSQASARNTFAQVAVLSISSFPQAIVPNKLLQELRQLARVAELSVPLLDELAADIFMGEFSEKFGAAAKLAGAQLAGSLYARYYDVDTESLAGMEFGKTHVAKGLGELCARRAGVKLGGWSAATNGCVIEQQQILTTQNLAGLYSVSEVRSVLQPQSWELAENTLRWLLGELAGNRPDRHSRLIAIKNAAYAWRQMLFYLSHLSTEEVSKFLGVIEELITKHPPQFGERFRPAVTGLNNVVVGKKIGEQHGQRLLGWTTSGHWLLENA